MPYLAALGLEHFPVNELEASRAYRQRLRANPSDANVLRTALSVLTGREAPAATQSVPAPPLALSHVPSRRGDIVHLGGEAACARSGRPAYGYASVQGRRPNMEDALIGVEDCHSYPHCYYYHHQQQQQ